MRYPQALIGILLCLLLSACASTPKERAAPKASLPPPALDQMNEKFLYLAAQDAIRHGQAELAIRFLQALTERDPDSQLPRLQLADLLLRTSRPAEALVQAEKAVQNLEIDRVSGNEEARPFLLYAQALTATGSLEQALDILETLLIREPTLLDARLLQIRILANEERTYEAYQSIRDGLRSGDSPALRNIHADLLMREGKLAAAEKELERLLELDPDDESALLTLSQLALQQGNMFKAETLLKDFIATHPRAMLSRNALGRILVQSNRIEEAIVIYRDLVRDTGSDTEIASALGLLYYQNRQFDKAAEQFRKIMKNAPDDDANIFYLASSLEAMGEADEASRLYQRVKSDSRIYVDAQLQLAGIALRAERVDEAMQRIRDVLREHPDSSGAYTLLSGIYLMQKKYRQLLDETERATSLPSVPPRLLFNRAVAFEFFKQYDDVETMLKAVLRAEPENTEALNFLGYIYAEQGIKLDEAEMLIKRALQMRADDGYFLDSLAWVYFKRGEYKKAADTQQQAITHVPDDPIIREHLGDILWMQGNQEAAREQWQNALDLKHDEPEKVRRKLEEGLH